MLQNYFITAFRNLWRNRIYSIINVSGLSVGLTACFLIYLYVSFETSYDDFHTKANRIYRVVNDIKTSSETSTFALTSTALPVNIKKDFPEVEDVVRISRQSFLIRKGDVSFLEKNSILADSSFFDVFDFPLIYGDKKTALKEPLSFVLTESAAKKYFGHKNPVGQHIIFGGAKASSGTVTGLMKDIPGNSQIKADVIVSLSSFATIWKFPIPDDEWLQHNYYSYLLLKPNTDYKALEQKFPGFLEKHIGSKMRAQQNFYTVFLEPLRDVYLRSKRDGFEKGNVNNVYIFSIIAIFILLIACVNFINLTTARSTERAKEIGVRKVVGAARMQLVKQFIIESVVICMVAFLLAVLLSSLLLPLFNRLAGKQISINILNNPLHIWWLFMLSLSIGLVAGLYPSLVLSSYKPVSVLKGRFATGTKGLALRKGLVIFQFTISIVMIIGTVIVYTQLHFMRSQDLGFNKDQTIIINTNWDRSKYALRQSISSISGVKSVSYSTGYPGGTNPARFTEIENNSGDMQKTNLDLYYVDYNYIDQYQLKLVAGRAFAKNFATDTAQAVVINESTSRLLGYSSPQQALGKRFEQDGRKSNIIGVLKDFHYKSLQETIKPLCMKLDPYYTIISIKVATSNLPGIIAAIRKLWTKADPYRPFEYYFLDEFFNMQYRAEEEFGSLFFNFALLAIFISCMGLFGLASYSTLQRTSEIGVRKLLGASVSSIVTLLSGDFIKLVLVAFIIAAPIGGYAMYEWLQDFAYRTRLTWWIFALAGVAALMIAFFTISFQAIRAARTNPVRCLRME